MTLDSPYTTTFDARTEENFVIQKVYPTNNRFLSRVKEVINHYLDEEDFNSELLCREIGASRSQVFRKIKELTGFSTALYIRHIRLTKSAELLNDKSYPIKIIAYSVGFRDVAYFSRCFKQTYGTSPSHYRLQALSEFKE